MERGFGADAHRWTRLSLGWDPFFLENFFRDRRLEPTKANGRKKTVFRRLSGNPALCGPSQAYQAKELSSAFPLGKVLGSWCSQGSAGAAQKV